MKNEKKFVKFLGYSILTMVFAILGISVLILQSKEVTVSYHGKNIEIVTFAATVEEFLNQNNIYIDSNTKLSNNLDDKLENNMNIELTYLNDYTTIDVDNMNEDKKVITTKLLQEDVEIPYETETIDNPAIYRGVQKVAEEGKNGVQENKYIVRYENDAEIEKNQISSNVKEEVVNKLVEVGTKVAPVVSRSNVVIPSVDSGFKVYNISLSKELQQYAYATCKEYGIQYELFLAMMFKESGYRSNAISATNDYGLCQINISNHSNLRKKLGISNFLDPYDNIKAGAYMLSLYFNSAKKFSSDIGFIEVYALNSYNMGEGSYYRNCYSQGVLHRTYSTSIRQFRDSIITNGGI